MTNGTSVSAVSWKFPSKSVIVPWVVPFISTFAPTMGSPCVSCTTPLTVICWAKVPTDIANTAHRVRQDLIKWSLFMSPKFFR